MSVELGALIVVVLIAVAIVTLLIYKKLPKRLKVDNFNDQWAKLQAFCADKKTWPDALSQADKLLDRALKKRKFKGKSMGERMVSAQKVFTDNDGLWFAHNLYKKVLGLEVKRIREEDIKEALIAYRQALRDLGALKK